MRLPKLLCEITNAMDNQGIPYALGGNGLLHALGLSETVQDWDLTVECPVDEVAQAVERHGAESRTMQLKPSEDSAFASEFRMAISDEECKIDLFGNFAIRTEYGTCHLPATPTSEWEGIQLGSPEVWAVAYMLMNREDKANRLLSYLRTHCANSNTIRLLLDEPLPQRVRDELKTLI